MDALKLIEQGSMKEAAPQIEIGDYVKVYVSIKEGEKSRIQMFEGTV
ncbi:MAG: 50S ribosomal protein L19, partial [Oscillospiraceae bacterium]|nr:50S ribosomal protein L19 [Oscillospiraceae bacterium]